MSKGVPTDLGRPKEVIFIAFLTTFFPKSAPNGNFWVSTVFGLTLRARPNPVAGPRPCPGGIPPPPGPEGSLEEAAHWPPSSRDCAWGPWAAWGSCSAYCAGGVQTRPPAPPVRSPQRCLSGTPLWLGGWMAPAGMMPHLQCLGEAPRGPAASARTCKRRSWAATAASGRRRRRGAATPCRARRAAGRSLTRTARAEREAPTPFPFMCVIFF